MGLIDFAEEQMKAISDLNVMIAERQTKKPKDFQTSCEEMWGFMQDEAKIFLNLRTFLAFKEFVDSVIVCSLSKRPARVVFFESDGHDFIEVENTFNELSDRWISLGHNIIKSIELTDNKKDFMVINFCAL